MWPFPPTVDLLEASRSGGDGDGRDWVARRGEGREGGGNWEGSGHCGRRDLKRRSRAAWVRCGWRIGFLGSAASWGKKGREQRDADTQGHTGAWICVDPTQLEAKFSGRGRSEFRKPGENFAAARAEDGRAGPGRGRLRAGLR